MTEQVRDRRCGKPTKKGTPCVRGLHSWMVDLGFEYADGCWGHMSQPFKEAAEVRKQAEESAWLAYLYAAPICWGWPVPADPDGWTYPQSHDPNDHHSEEAIALLMGTQESRSNAMLIWWQDGRCAICGHRRDLAEDHDHVTGMVRGYLCRGCNVQEGIYGGADTLFGQYRERYPTKILGLSIRYWDPLTQDYAQPAVKRIDEDPWTEAASEDIGL